MGTMPPAWDSRAGAADGAGGRAGGPSAPRTAAPRIELKGLAVLVGCALAVLGGVLSVAGAEGSDTEGSGTAAPAPAAGAPDPPDGVAAAVPEPATESMADEDIQPFLQDGLVAEWWEAEVDYLDETCGDVQRTEVDDLEREAALLERPPTEGARRMRSSRLTGRELNRVALLGEGPRDTRLLSDMGVDGGWEHVYATPDGVVRLAYLEFGSPFQACRFVEFDFLYHPGTDLRIIDALPGGWEAVDPETRHLHFGVADRAYLFSAEVDVADDVLEAAAVAQLDALEGS